MSYTYKKSEEYLRKNNIIQDDEEFLMSFPNVVRTESMASILWLALMTFAFLLLILGAVLLVLVSDGWSYWEDIGLNSQVALLIGLIFAILGVFFLYTSIKGRNKARDRIHNFLTSKRIYFNPNIQKPYEHMEIKDLIRADMCIQPYSNALTDFYFSFTTNNMFPIIIPTTAELIETDKFFKIFPNPDILIREFFPMQYLRDGMYYDNENSYDHENNIGYENSYENSYDYDNNNNNDNNNDYY